MVLKAPHLTLLLLLSVVFLAFLSDVSAANFQTFKRQHIDNSRSPADPRTYCNRMMQRRRMTRPRCKPTNTFIHASNRQIQSICTGRGTNARGNLFNSHDTFRLTTCRLSPGSRPGRCNYRGVNENRRVQVACVRRLPVHFQTAL